MDQCNENDSATREEHADNLSFAQDKWRSPTTHALGMVRVADDLVLSLRIMSYEWLTLFNTTTYLTEVGSNYLCTLHPGW
jgi:hypothetical protein